MSLIKWEPFGEIDRFFEDFSPALRTSNMGWDLAVDVFEEKDNIVAEMNLPGINANDIDVSAEDGYLRISGSRNEETESKDKHFYSKEIRRGSFDRAVRIPEHIDRDKITAEYKKGVLRVTMPKGPEPKTGKIKVEVKD